jgi:hypothetical protein
MTPLSRSRHVCQNISITGNRFPNEDETNVIEAELNKRCQGGDKTAELVPFWPESSPAHIRSALQADISLQCATHAE